MVVKINSYSTDQIIDEKREECGIVGIYSKTGQDVAPLLHRALIALQHRGQDAAGFAVWNGKKIEECRGIGLVDSVVKEEDLRIPGSIGIGHTRYPTHGECHGCDVQPFVYKNYAAAHNGHIANYKELKKEFQGYGYNFTSSVDSEVMVYYLDRYADTKKAVEKMMDSLEGAYSVTGLANGELIVFRDKFAIRPLVWGENEDFVCFTSESAALDVNKIPFKGSVNGGELIVVRGKQAKIEKFQIKREKMKHCMFEYVYFSRPDSLLDHGLPVHVVREKLGIRLAKSAPVKADVVVPVPDTSRTAATAYARELGIPCEEGLIKNRYIGRTFIMPDQNKRSEAVRLKLNPVTSVVKGKRVVLIDDSIVRGTTLREIVTIVREAGAKEVHLRITSPPIKAPCFYGVDMSTYNELIANKKTVEEICKYLNADSLEYLSIEDLRGAIGFPICTGCLNEDYHTDYVKRAARIKAQE